MEPNWILAALVAGPILLGLLALVLRAWPLRILLVLAAAACVVTPALTLVRQPSLTIALGAGWAPAAAGLELALAGLFLFIGYRIRSVLLILMATAQLALLILGDTLPRAAAAEPAVFRVDALSLVLVLIISIIGTLIVVYALGYMRKHEEHAPATAASTSRFFFFLIAFLGLMNGLVLADDLKWLSIFWEGTTLCSFFLIGHDGTDESRANARRALLINAFGGLALTFAAYLSLRQTGGETLAAVMASAALLPMGLLCLAGFAKSAQLPFQSWLLGAMVAPTPVSALLHSSTMVKAGSYLVLRLAPAFGGTRIGPIVAFAGAFTFAVASGLAISQENGKRVLAYSTVANLGLIVACAGIGTPLAYSAAMLILVFHALSKAVLFLCVGTIEQSIGSRYIEDMSGIMFKMPLTTVIATLGMVSMVAPPFGMLVGKWVALESSVHAPAVMLLLAIGSALTVFFWAKWIGRITTASYHEEYQVERVSAFMSGSMLLLVAGVVACSVAALPLYHGFLTPMAVRLYPAATAQNLALMGAASSFIEWPLFLVFGLVLLGMCISLLVFRRSNLRLPFLCGENIAGSAMSYDFRSLRDEKVTAYVTSYYLAPIFGEQSVTKWANPVALMVLIVLFGVISR